VSLAPGNPELPVARQVADFAVGARLQDLPAQAWDRALKAVVDTLGVLVAGARSEVGAPVGTYAAAGEVAGSGGCPVLGSPLRLSREQAALVMGTFAHALDYDDVDATLPGHPSAVLVPALLAQAGAGGVSGRGLLEAYVVGHEVASKLGVGIGQGHYGRGWHATSTLGLFGAVAALGRVRGAEVETVTTALGLAASLASGVRANFGSMAKPMHCGWAARSAVAAVDMAAAGLSASADALEGPHGFFRVYGAEGSDALRVGALLGAPFTLDDPGVGLKPWPCCFGTHRALDAALEIARRPQFTSDDVVAVRCAVPPGGLRALRSTPARTGLEGKFSMEYVLAAALVDGEVGLGTFTDEAVRRADLQELAARVGVREDPACSDGRTPVDPQGVGFAEVAVTLRDGRVEVARVSAAPGSRQREMPWAQVSAKFVDCLGVAGTSAEDATQALTVLRGLEQWDDAGRVFSLLA
jgi:2-methylcitrate dehydratase PrpD